MELGLELLSFQCVSKLPSGLFPPTLTAHRLPRGFNFCLRLGVQVLRENNRAHKIKRSLDPKALSFIDGVAFVAGVK